MLDALYYRRAHDEMPWVNARGELKRIDRLVEIEDECVTIYRLLSQHFDKLRAKGSVQCSRRYIMLCKGGARSAHPASIPRVNAPHSIKT
ncbi:MAG: hypothetical protein B7Y56_05460 [Gallionellales bacterium 35-53-114]|nr:MAG: hypothetical protein B7Y56_05460 [Gallionellales bacterium 35-53-114]OZB09511.1 MAG: hypothetical protein B7X61_07640 [Gallionellales bacterium 39-52-133]HQS57822.1 hypothetical protein [Gallionellaceae bacterium]HQS74275.1 hypothetical protein [Gallionellaceae bacterium]